MFKPKFVKLTLRSFSALNSAYLTAAIDLMFKHQKALFDDFLNFTAENRLAKGLELIQHFSPFFWAVINPQTAELAGIVYLYNVVGGYIPAAKNPKILHSAYVSVCFKHKYWGNFVLKAQKSFLRYVFGKLKFYKLFAEIYTNNPLGRRFAEKAGFLPICKHKSQTLKNGALADTILYEKVRNNTNI